MESGMNKNAALLTIAIPTFNRSIRLEKSLTDLLAQIVAFEHKELICILVSNNGSTDQTIEILDRQKTKYTQKEIPFYIYNNIENQGFDTNVLCCYRKCQTDFIWFLSDDDNIQDCAIEVIIKDIQEHFPNVLYYNFDQEPFSLKNALVKKSKLYINVESNNIESISKILKSPKLTSVVIRKVEEVEDKVKSYKFNFMHIALAIQTALDYGRVFHSEIFIARPDSDFLDQIDFVPFIGNDLDKTAFHLLTDNNKSDMYQLVKVSKVDPLLSCLDNLTSYYKGKCALTPKLKSELYSTIRSEIKNIKITEAMKIAIIGYYIFRYILGYLYNSLNILTTGKAVARLRNN
jgi:glycosyltransferase involved in cell wall biosynthesis